MGVLRRLRRGGDTPPGPTAPAATSGSESMPPETPPAETPPAETSPAEAPPAAAPPIAPVDGGTVCAEGVDPIPVLTVPYLGHPFLYPPASAVGQAVGRAWEWDAVLRPMLAALVPDDEPIICEVGSNIGASLLEILLVKPRARIFSFEPSDYFRAVLVENLRLAGFGHIEVLPFLVGRTPGEGVIYTDDTSGSKEDLPHYLHRQASRIVTLDGVLDGHAPVRFIKTDTDGNDIEVLRGAAGILARDRPDVFIEFCPPLMGTDPVADLAWLIGMGYPRLVCFDNLGHAVGVTGDPGQAVRWSIEHGYCDILAPADPEGTAACALVDSYLASSRHTGPA